MESILFAVMLIFLFPFSAPLQSSAPPDQQSLLAFKAAIIFDPNDALANWNTTIPFCTWTGVSCAPHSQNVVRLDLTFMDLYGVLSPALGNLTTLVDLFLAYNTFSRTIPPSITKLSALRQLDLSDNFMDGPIPHGIGMLTQLSLLYLKGNQLSGSIPSSMGNLSQLVYLRLSENGLTGPIPREIGSLRQLQWLRLSNNLLSGTIPAEIGMLINLDILTLRGNELSGSIPNSLGNCSKITFVDLSNNNLSGEIPDAFGKLQNLSSLDLSHNFLSGGIPTYLTNMKGLGLFNASFNNLTGQVPALGLSLDSTRNAKTSFMGNSGLCGPAKYQVRACPNESKRVKSLLTKVMLPAAGMIFFVLCTSLFGILWCRKCPFPEYDLPDFIKTLIRYPEFTYQDLVTATDGFNDRNLIDSGRFGSVYKGILRDGKVVAIKVLSLQTEEVGSSFKREWKVLAKTRHRNLVRVISAYSYLHFKALILQFATNGSLEKHLYPDSHEHNVCELKIKDCLNIAIDVANGMEYLHHDCPTQIVHCDLKPSNVLLDSDMTALVADFGISKLTAPTDSIDSLSTTIAMKGSIGYIPPEYGLGMNISTKGDVYSYGILLLEMVTRKRPTDAIFGDSLNLPKWVRSAFPERLADIVDKGFLQNLELEVDECLVSYIHIALLCTSDSRRERPSMRDVRKTLEMVRSKMIGGATLTSYLRRTISDLLLKAADNAQEGGASASGSSTY